MWVGDEGRSSKGHHHLDPSPPLPSAGANLGRAVGEGGRRGCRRMQDPDPLNAITGGRDEEGARRRSRMQGALVSASSRGRGERRNLPAVRGRSREWPGAANVFLSGPSIILLDQL